MFRFLLWIFRPEKLPSPRRKKVPFLVRCRISIYAFLLNIKKRHYRRYAIMDEISYGDVKFVWERRDIAFEDELKRMGHNVKPQMSSNERVGCNWGKTASPRRKGRSFRWFRFSETIRIIANDGEVSFDHSSDLSINGSLKGLMKLSAGEDIISRSRMKISRSAASHVRQISVARPERRKPVFAKEKQPEPTVTVAPAAPVAPAVPEAPVIRKAGFDIDTSF